MIEAELTERLPKTSIWPKFGSWNTPAIISNDTRATRKVDTYINQDGLRIDRVTKQLKNHVM